MEGVSDAEEEEVTFAVALVTVCGTICIFALPLVSRLLGLSDLRFGTWVGVSVHDVGQVVATASTGGPEVLQTAVIVKLARVVLLAPIIVGLSLVARARSAKQDASTETSRPPLLPFFVFAFLLAAGLRSLGVVDDGAAASIKQWQEVFLAAALVGLGAGVVIAKLRRLGGRALSLGLIAWVVMASGSLLAVLVLVR